VRASLSPDPLVVCETAGVWVHILVVLRRCVCEVASRLIASYVFEVKFVFVVIVDCSLAIYIGYCSIADITLCCGRLLVGVAVAFVG
jgi:hypothetical protein